MTRTAVRGGRDGAGCCSRRCPRPAPRRPRRRSSSARSTAAAATPARPIRNDFIELFNRGTAPVDVTGWSVQYTSASGTGLARRDRPCRILHPASTTSSRRRRAPGDDGLPTPDAVGTIAMGATAGKVALVPNGARLACSGCPFAGHYRDARLRRLRRRDASKAPARRRARRTPPRPLRRCSAAAPTRTATPPTSPPRPAAQQQRPSTELAPPPPPDCPPSRDRPDPGQRPRSPPRARTCHDDGFVTARVAWQQRGFFLQTPDGEADARSRAPPRASSCSPAPRRRRAAVGNAVQVSGTVAEFVPPADPASPPLTEISSRRPSSCSRPATPLPAP